MNPGGVDQDIDARPALDDRGDMPSVEDTSAREAIDDVDELGETFGVFVRALSDAAEYTFRRET